MDFFQIRTKETRGGVLEIYPDFTVGRSKDLMVRAKSFYAIWDDAKNLWSTDEYDVQRLVDEELDAYAEKLKADGISCTVKHLRSFTTNGWNQFRKFMANISDNSHQLDQKLTFANTEVKKTDYVSKRLPYPLAPGDHSSWDKLVGRLYLPEERAKIEWTIGAIISGDSRKIQKFLVLYGPRGTGKSTILDIVQKLFEGYYTTFEAKALVGNNNSFSTEAFRTNPLVAIQHESDLSKIEDHTKLNSIISHEEMRINEKFKPSYSMKINAMLMIGTNKPVRISDAKSGIIRRLIDVRPTGSLFSPNEYNTTMSKIDFELGAIAHHCLQVYRDMGKNFYHTYHPTEMMLQTDIFFNYIDAYHDIFKNQNGATLKQAYALYKEYCSETGIEFVLPQYKFREELRNYFEDFHDRISVEGAVHRSYYSGFKALPSGAPSRDEQKIFSLVLDETESLLDIELAACPAQYAKADGTPRKYWTDDPRLIDGVLATPKPSQVVSTVLSDLDTSKEHYVRPPRNHIVIDFDLRGEDGSKDLARNLLAASEWPATYGELSKSGSGVHLHYNYSGGDPGQLSPVYSEGIEVKSFGAGYGSLRRCLTKCNRIPIADINTGLPLKEKKMLDVQTIKSEKGLRALIARNLKKEIHPGTKPSIDFIKKILDDYYESGEPYDLTDMRTDLVAFANNSTNQALACLKIVQNMKFKSETSVEELASRRPTNEEMAKDDRLVFFDVEVFPNLFIVCWSYEDSDTVVEMINPSPQDMEPLLRFKLVGFNNRRYDNHMIYARYLGYTNQQLFELSQKIINTGSGLFGEAFDLSYADIFDFSSKKQSLKKFQIDLGIRHVELDLPWEQPVPEDQWLKVSKYCANDTISTKEVFKARKQDFVARQILSDLSGLSVNDTTARHTARIIFGNDKNPQRSFVYTDLSKEFPGYKYDKGVSTYRGEVTGEGGYVYAEPGMYENVAVLDVASMHPTSIIQLELFGKYTKNFGDLVDARLAIKRKNYDYARTLLEGKLAKYLGDPEGAEGLSDALKIVVNIVYGLTSAKFDNPFRDVHNKDNIVAKRGALFMVDLKHAVQEQGFTVAHIKTDSVKIPDATSEIIEFVKDFGKRYGYTFEYKPEKDFYDALCLVNDAVYIARQTTQVSPVIDGEVWEGRKDKWTAVGAQFQHPYVFKALFSGEDITFDDLCETKQVSQGAMYLDFGTDVPPVRTIEDMHFIGRTGQFVPVKEGFGGGILYRIKEGKAYAVTGTKGYLWMEAEMARKIGPSESLEATAIDMRYFENLAEEARKTIDYFGDYTRFIG